MHYDPAVQFIIEQKLAVFDTFSTTFVYWFTAIIALNFAMIWGMYNARTVAKKAPISFFIVSSLGAAFVLKGIPFSFSYIDYLSSLQVELNSLLSRSGRIACFFNNEVRIAKFAIAGIIIAFYLFLGMYALMVWGIYREKCNIWGKKMIAKLKRR